MTSYDENGDPLFSSLRIEEQEMGLKFCKEEYISDTGKILQILRWFLGRGFI